MYLIIVSLIVVLDQITKYLAVKHLKGQKPYIIIENFLQLDYVENSGAAFGILQDRKIFFVIITTLVIIGITITLFKYSYKFNNLMIAGLLMLLGGTIGNFIDRIRLSYVIDFLSVKFGRNYSFPVFNVADMFIVIGTFLIMLMVSLNRYEA